MREAVRSSMLPSSFSPASLTFELKVASMCLVSSSQEDVESGGFQRNCRCGTSLFRGSLLLDLLHSVLCCVVPFSCM